MIIVSSILMWLVEVGLNYRTLYTVGSLIYYKINIKYEFQIS